jgi:hypothetical protein
MSTMKVKPWHESQGDHVLIEASDFDPKFHAAFEEPAADAAPGKKRGKKEPAADAAE